VVPAGILYNGGTVQDRLTQAATEYLREQGMELVELKVVSRKGGPFLRLIIDRPGGVTIDDCVRVHGELRWLLQADAVVPGEVDMEVSSPGPRRKLRVPEDLERFLGEPVRVVLNSPVKGLYVITGVLKGMDGDKVFVAPKDSEDVEVLIGQIKRAHLWR